MKRRTPLCGALLAAAAVSLVGAEITLPAETARLKESALPGYALASASCYTCHSVDYVSSQPPMTRAAWQASVLKMRKTFGAAIPDDAVEPIAEYLAKTYGTERADSARAKSENGKSAPRR